MPTLRPDQNRLNTLEEASKRLKVSVDYLRIHVRQGNIKAVKIGRNYRISEEEMQRIFRDGLRPPNITPTKSYGKRNSGIIS